MNITVIDPSKQSKVIEIKAQNFGDLIDELGPSARFADFQFYLNGNLLQNIEKDTKLSNVCGNQEGKIEIKKKESIDVWATQVQQLQQIELGKEDVWATKVQQKQQNQFGNLPPSSGPLAPNEQKFIPRPAQIPLNSVCTTPSTIFSNGNKNFTPIPLGQTPIAPAPGASANVVVRQTNSGIIRSTNIVPLPNGEKLNTPSIGGQTVQQPGGVRVITNVQSGFPAPTPATFKPILNDQTALPRQNLQTAAFTPIPVVSTNTPDTNVIPQNQQITNFPLPTFCQQSAIIDQQKASQVIRKSVDYRDEIIDEKKTIFDFEIKITGKGNKVEVESRKYDMKATFLEENANEKIQQQILQQLTPDVYPTDQRYLAKCLVGQKNESTKVIVKKNLDGLAIRWATGLTTLFDFDLAM